MCTTAQRCVLRRRSECFATGKFENVVTNIDDTCKPRKQSSVGLYKTKVARKENSAFVNLFWQLPQKIHKWLQCKLKKQQKDLQYALVDIGATHGNSLRLSARLVFADE